VFVDVAKISIKAGNGGDGKVSFHREKYVAAGGPDGGDGGKGGDIVFVVDNNMSTLMDFSYKRKYVASDGQNGQQKKSFGKDGEDLIIRVPMGTLIKDSQSGKLIKDMSDLKPFIGAKGGRGGWGNTHFATPTRQAPRFAKSGTPGEKRDITLELKLIADVGLLGFPNVGNSTFLSVVSSARPKIADYHFTTLTPNLGVVYVDEGVSFVMADIPGIIEGASGGAGLGHAFLRHIERCRLLVHIVDVSAIEGRNPIEDFNTKNLELKSYSEKLSTRPQIVVANKIDILTDNNLLDKFEEYVKGLGYEFYKMSAASNIGIKEVINAVSKKLSQLAPVETYEAEFIDDQQPKDNNNQVTIHIEDGVYYVEGEWLLNLLGLSI
jgi:GTP-binding protein